MSDKPSPDDAETHEFFVHGGVNECHWCGIELDASELDAFTTQYDSWQSGEVPASHYPEFDRGYEPLPTCDHCLESIEDNYDDILLQRDRATVQNQSMVQTMILLLLGLGFAYLVSGGLW